MSQSTPALEAFSVNKSLSAADGEPFLWRSPDLVVQPGEFVAVVGDRHDDLRLLFGILSGLVEPTSGVLRMDGQAIEDLPRLKRAALRSQKIGLLFSESKLLPDLTVLDNVTLARRHRGLSRRETQERARGLLKGFGLSHALSKKPVALTPMEAQLVALARALIHRPVVLLAYEPTANLASEESEQYLRLVREVCREQGAAVLLGTSDRRWSSLAEREVELPGTGSEASQWAGDEISSGDLYGELYETEISPLLRPVGPLLDYVVKPLLYTSVVALLIVFLTFFGLTMAQAGSAGRNLDLGAAVTDALGESVTYWRDLTRGNLGWYDNQIRFHYWMAGGRPISEAIQRTLSKSVGLLLLSMALGTLIGVPLGLLAALVRHRRFSLFFLVAAIVGVSTPSFFLALLLQILEISVYRRTGVALLPVGGFGWDEHLVLPALVLAARPIAQIARVSSVALAEVLDADYIRTARAKGLTAVAVLLKHALRNAGVPILAVMGASLGFSLSSLPIVESIFQWPGMGDLLLSAIRTNQPRLAATLAVLLGVFFVVIHVALDFFYRMVDPRLREEKFSLGVQRNWTDLVVSGWSTLRDLPGRVASLLPGLGGKPGERLPALLASAASRLDLSAADRARDAKIRVERRRAWMQSTIGSLPFVLGGIILAALLVVIVVGQRVAPYSAYTVFPSLEINGQLQYAPFPPSSAFLLGTDPQGRDILTLLLYGARRTMSLAFFAVLARILLGTVLGALAGWFSDSLLDHAITSLTQVVAAFPALLMAMVLIYAFGIRQGLWVFAAALCLIGWGESAQFVRSQVMHIREQDYVEGALAVGLGDVQLLARHVLPNLVPSLVVLACLEMGGVLMILGELGFVGVFIGGGTQTTSAADTLVRYFDVPEWGVMLSNTWRSFRSYPWMTFFPALAFTLSIVGFNLMGEGLRRLTERLTLTMHRIINRYTIAGVLGIGALLLVAAEGTGSWAQFSPIAQRFDTERAMADIAYLASPEREGRSVGSPGLAAAADYIADQFATLGLQPAGPEVDGALSYFVDVPYEFTRLTSVPSLELWDSSGQMVLPLVYRRDYAEVPDAANHFSALRAPIICVAMGSDVDAWPQNIDIEAPELLDKVILLPDRRSSIALSNLRLRGVLVVADSDDLLTHRQLATNVSLGYFAQAEPTAYLYISPGTADAILRRSGHSLEEVRQRQSRLTANEGFALSTGVEAVIDIEVSDSITGTLPYVQAFVPGRDVGSRARDVGMDREMVVVLAHYDGLGQDWDGTPYPGANKNASGVAVMLETARILTEADYQPYRTLMFVAWAGEELHAPPSFWNILRGRVGWLERYLISAVVELNGVGAGTGNALIIQRSTSGRLTDVLQQAAKRLKVNTSTLGVPVNGVYSSAYTKQAEKVAYISLTWEGSYVTALTSQDTVDGIQADKLRDAGRVAALAVMYLGHEKEY
jgi:peptide/nickel transport system permease protein